VKDEAGDYTFPNLKNISAAAEMVKKVPASNELQIVGPPKRLRDHHRLEIWPGARLRAATESSAQRCKMRARGSVEEITRGGRRRDEIEPVRAPPVPALFLLGPSC